MCLSTKCSYVIHFYGIKEENDRKKMLSEYHTKTQSEFEFWYDIPTATKIRL